MEFTKLVLSFGLVTLTLTMTVSDDDISQSVTEVAHNTTCLDQNCSSPAFLSTTLEPEPEADKTDPCSEQSSGWGLKGSDWGCCGNYEGCCTYASLFCYFHDAMCECCDNNFCGPTCKPEVECFKEKEKEKQAFSEFDSHFGEKPMTKQENFFENDNPSIKEEESKENGNKTDGESEPKRPKDKNKSAPNKLQTTSPSTSTSSAIPEKYQGPEYRYTSPESRHEFLNVEELEKAINTTDAHANFDFEIEKLLNETEALLEQHDEVFEEFDEVGGSGEAEFKPDI